MENTLVRSGKFRLPGKKALQASDTVFEVILADAGYQGLADLHENCQTPFKKSKYHALTKREKQKNRALARKRIVIEHIFRNLKIFRILSEKYRNRRKRFPLRFNLIAAIYNLQLNSF